MTLWGRKLISRTHSQCEDDAFADDRRHWLGPDGGQPVDTRYGSFVVQDLASYHVAVNADVGEMEVVFLDEDDAHGSPLGSKGIGELGICRAGAAVMNAIHNATGARIHDFPAAPDKLLPALQTLDSWPRWFATAGCRQIELAQKGSFLSKAC
jgi:hypothetical protein